MPTASDKAILADEARLAALEPWERNYLRTERHKRERREQHSKWMNDRLPEIQAGEDEFDFQRRQIEWAMKWVESQSKEDIALFYIRAVTGWHQQELSRNHLFKQIAGIRAIIDGAH